MQRQSKNWSDEELALLSSNISTSEISERTGRSISAIRDKRHKIKYGFEKSQKYNVEARNRYYKCSAYAGKHRQKWSTTECEMLFDTTKSDTQLSKELDRSVGAIQMKRYRLLGKVTEV